MKSFLRFALPLLSCVLAASVEASAQPIDPAERENAGAGVNSPAVEILPIVSPDGKTLYFDRKNDSNNTGGVDDDDDIYVSTVDPEGNWTTAVNIGPPLNSKGSDLLFWISPDGSNALVYSSSLVDRSHTGLAITRRSGSRWGTPKPIEIAGLKSLGDVYYATISPDQRRLFIAYNADTSNPNNLDIFSCPALSPDLTSWGAPMNLGPSINTQGFEGGPFMAADNRTLYFLSDGRSGMGRADIYVSRRIGEGWVGWTTAVNLGPGVNTPFPEASLSIPARGSYAYVSGGSYEGTNLGKSDIYRVKIPDTLRPNPVAIIVGTLVARGEGVEGLVRAERRSDRKEVSATTSSSDGRFILLLPLGHDYRLTGWAENYQEAAEKLDLRTTTVEQQEVTISLDGSKATADISPDIKDGFRPIYFAVDSDEITPEGERIMIQNLASVKALLSNSRIAVNSLTVRGFTDSVGTESDNQGLGHRRAERVAAWLVEHGIDRSLIAIEVEGEKRPAATNETAGGRALNRRVEIGVGGRREK